MLKFQESMSEEGFEECFPLGFDPTKRNGKVFDEVWFFPGNIDDYDAALRDFIEHHWCPHQAFDELNNGHGKIAAAVANAFWSGYIAGLHLGREE